MPELAIVPYAARRDAVRAHLLDAQVDALLVTDLRNVRYLTAFTGSAGAVLVALDRERDHLATDGRYAEQSALQVPDLPRTISRKRDWVREALVPGGMLAVEGTLAWSDARDLQALLGEDAVVPLDGVVEQVRAVKDATEITQIAAACQLAGEAFLATLEHIVPGVTERDVAARLERTMVDFGADDRAFPSIVASGPNGARPHHRPTDRVLQRGDLITLDFGALIDGYHSDMTRMVAIGQLDAELQRIVDVVHRAQRRGLEEVRSGRAAGEVDAVCRTSIEEDGYGERFVHGTGHGVGLDLHEAPFVSDGASATLRDRMVVTVEPGVYLPGIGGARIEDTVVIGPQGADVLTTIPSGLYVR
jgi:Xaa-Pro aminopeptidase